MHKIHFIFIIIILLTIIVKTRSDVINYKNIANKVINEPSLAETKRTVNNDISILNNKEEYNITKNDNPLIKHFVIIRFYCINMMGKEKLFDYSLLHDGVKNFKKFILKSLENQTNNNFEIIIMIHNDIPDNNKAILELKSVSSKIKINIIHFRELNKFIDDNVKDADFLITTRIDHDDLIYNDAVNEIQNKCNNDIPLYYNGYMKGITMTNDNINQCYKHYPKYNKGTSSQFQSLIVNRRMVNQNINIYILGNGNHTKQIDSFINLYKEYKYKYNKLFFNKNNLEDSFIYIKHDFNHSTNIAKKSKWHNTNIKINKPKEWFIERFGNFIDDDEPKSN